jgi:hypothetical protein
MNAHTKSTKVLAFAMFVAALVGSGGCAKMSWKPSKMFSLDNTWPFRDENAPREGTPMRLVGTWTDTVMTQPGKKPQRGFGGRLMFYEKDEKKPILVNGQLVVYAFDETGRDPTDNKPTRRYVFPVDQMPLHMSKNEFGASYSFFLPWDEAGGPKTEVSLVCRFEPVGGSVVTGEQTRHLLPGTMPVVAADGSKRPPKLPEGVPSKPAIQTLQSLQAKRLEEHNAQWASYETAVPANPQQAGSVTLDADGFPVRQMTATTINLPGNFQMPTAAAFAPPANPATGNMQPAATSYQQPPLIQRLPQQALAMNPMVPAAAPPATVQSTVMQPLGVNRAIPGAQPMMQLPAAYCTTPAGQSPLVQQQAQQAAQQATLQQQLQQQMLMQQQALQQQRMLQPQPPPIQQTPGQAGGTATVSYPAGGQYLR